MTLTHINSEGEPTMVDVGKKDISNRSATAQATIRLTPELMQMMEEDEIIAKKGPVKQTAILAGIMGAKRTSDLIPLCHSLNLTNCQIQITQGEDDSLVIKCTVSISDRTGVEMEALTGASIAALTIYDMCKAYSHEIEITSVKLLEKTGGKKDYRHG